MRAPFSILIALALAGGTLPASAAPFWQKPKPPAANTRAAPHASALAANNLMGQSHTANANSAPQGGQFPLHLHGPGPHNGDWLRKYGELPPAEQEQKLQSDPVFRSLTPEKQQSLLNRLRNFNSLTPSKRQQVLNRMETYEHLSPAQQKQADDLYQRYRGLPADQQGQVSQAYKDLRKMNPEQRAEYFNSDEFRNGMNDEQRSLLRGMSELYPNSVK